MRVVPQLGSEGRKGLLLRTRCALEKKKNRKGREVANDHGENPVRHDSYRTLQKRYQPRSVAYKTPGDFEFEQHAAHICCGAVR